MTGSDDLRVRRWADPRAFGERARPWLLQREAEHNLLLGIVDQLVADPGGYDPPIYLATVERAGEVVGCAFRTPPHKLGLTRMPLEALPALVRDVAEVYPTLATVLGTEDAAGRFGEEWGALRGVEARPGMRQRLYACEAVVPPERPAPGSMRPAEERDVPLMAAWLTAFAEDTGIASRDPERTARMRVAQGSFWLWEDGGRPASLAGWPARTERWARVGYVYTPPELRRRGYASALVAGITSRLLADGCRYTVLYTDLGNPTSNALYQRMGYRPLMDVMDVDFVTGEEGEG